MCQPCLVIVRIVFLPIRARLTLSLPWVLPWHTQLLLNSSRGVPLKHPALATSSSSASSLNDLALSSVPSPNGSKWRSLPSCQAPPHRRRDVLSNYMQAVIFAVNKRSLIHQILHLLLPTLQSDAVIFTSTPPCARLVEFVMFFFSYLVWLCWALRCVHSWARLTLQAAWLKFTQ